MLNGKVNPGSMVGKHAGDMIGEIALAIKMGAKSVTGLTHNGSVKALR